MIQKEKRKNDVRIGKCIGSAESLKAKEDLLNE